MTNAVSQFITGSSRNPVLRTSPHRFPKHICQRPTTWLVSVFIEVSPDE
jgi:hypothetical protein